MGLRDETTPINTATARLIVASQNASTPRGAYPKIRHRNFELQYSVLERIPPGEEMLLDLSQCIARQFGYFNESLRDFE